MNYPAGGWKVNLLKKELERRKEKEEEGFIMFTDSYDVIFAAGQESILGKYINISRYIMFEYNPFWVNI